MGVCTNLAKCVLAIINVILWATAILLIFVAGWVSREYFSYRSNLLPVISSTLVPIFIVFVAGLLLFVFVAVGCVALLKENKCLLALFFAFLLLLLLAFLSGFVASLIFKDAFDKNVYARLRHGINNYKTDMNSQDHVDFIQSEVFCCGVDNFTDWKTTSWYNTSYPEVLYPPSCCKNGVCHYGEEPEDRNLYQKGCYGEVKRLISNHFIVFVSSATGCSLLVVLGMICSCVLFCQGRRRETRHYVGLTNAEEAE